MSILAAIFRFVRAILRRRATLALKNLAKDFLSSASWVSPCCQTVKRLPRSRYAAVLRESCASGKRSRGFSWSGSTQ